MQPIKELLDKIRWDERENPEDYVLLFYDRVADQLEELAYLDIQKIEEGFLLCKREGLEVHIPLHRIKKVLKKGEVVWER